MEGLENAFFCNIFYLKIAYLVKVRTQVGTALQSSLLPLGGRWISALVFIPSHPPYTYLEWPSQMSSDLPWVPWSCIASAAVCVVMRIVFFPWYYLVWYIEKCDVYHQELRSTTQVTYQDGFILFMLLIVFWKKSIVLFLTVLVSKKAIMLLNPINCIFRISLIESQNFSEYYFRQCLK